MRSPSLHRRSLVRHRVRSTASAGVGLRRRRVIAADFRRTVVRPLGSLSDVSAALLRRDAGLPEEPGRLRQAGRHAARRRDGGRPTTRRPPTSSSSTRAPSSTPPARSRSTPCSPSTSAGATARASSSPAAWPSATATSWPPPCPRSTRSPGSASGSTLHARPADAARPQLIPVSDAPLPAFDLLNLPRPTSAGAVGVRQDRRGLRPSCGFCAIPSFRGPQRSRDVDSILDRGRRSCEAREIVLVAQDLASYGKDRPGELGAGAIVPLVRAVAERVDRVRLLYLYPSDLPTRSIDAICDTGVPYFDLSLQHVSKPLLRRMRRWGDGDRFLRRIADIREPRARRRVPQQLHRRLPGRDRSATTTSCCASSRRRSSTGAGSSPTAGRTARTPPTSTARCPQSLMPSGWPSCTELQDAITAARRDELIGADGRGARRRAGRRPQPPRGAGDRRRRPRRAMISRGGVRRRSRSSTRSAPTSSPPAPTSPPRDPDEV